MRRLSLMLALLVAVPLLLPSAPAAARRPDVVLVTLDEFTTENLIGPRGRLDRIRYPGFATLARHSTWFRNATTTADDTVRSIPAIFDGRRPRSGLLPTARRHPHSIFTLLHHYGFRIRAFETATAVCPRRICPNTPRFPPLDLFQHRTRKLAAFIRTIHRSKRPTFYYAHSVLPHGPETYLPSGRVYHAYSPRFTHDVGSSLGYDNPFLSEQLWQRHLLQVELVDRYIGRLVRRLTRLGLLRRAMLVVTADEGISYEAGVHDRRAISARNIDEVAPVPTFVKLPGQRHGRVSRSYVRTMDILPTVARALHLRVPWHVDGTSMFGRAARRRRGVRIRKRTEAATVVISARAFERRRRANARRALRLFGWGHHEPGLFGIGPHRELLGRALSELQVGSSSLTRTGPAQVRFDPRSSFAPVWQSGTINGDGPDARRDLAVALNGRVRAVGQSFHLGDGWVGEKYSLIVPEQQLRPGLNGVELLEVRREGGGLRLYRIPPSG